MQRIIYETDKYKFLDSGRINRRDLKMGRECLLHALVLNNLSFLG